MLAPFAAASLMPAMAFCMFSSLFELHDICTKPTFTFDIIKI
jgi:hypothetical protein